MTENKRGNRRIIIGTVVSDKMDKSRVIKVERSVKHPLYKKYIKQTKKFMVHDEKNESHIGDVVKVMEVRPLSRKKRWRLSEIIERAK
ncbi:MAG: 30S ribosomal protein S17 [Calditrichaeota bacterium]|nr:30S ribosomal protein S17 [Calditrichota bacterium]